MSYYERHLPHWQPEGAALFVTWRLHGSVPAAPGIITFDSIDRALASDTRGPHWLNDERVASCIADSLRFGEKPLNLYELHAWVIMSNHVHMLMTPATDPAGIMRRVKGFSARQANNILGRTGQPFWQDESFDRWVRDRDEFGKIVRYIEANPVSAGLVERGEDWKWSSAFQAREWTGLEACPTEFRE